jgi:hypothetical protein
MSSPTVRSGFKLLAETDQGMPANMLLKKRCTYQLSLKHKTPFAMLSYKLLIVLYTSVQNSHDIIIQSKKVTISTPAVNLIARNFFPSVITGLIWFSLCKEYDTFLEVDTKFSNIV